MYIGISLRLSMLSSAIKAIFHAELKTSIVPHVGTLDSFTHATSYIVDDWEGVKHETLVSEAAFWGGRRVHNLLINSEDFLDASWTLGALGTGILPTITPSYGADPDGKSSSATRLQLDSGTAGLSQIQHYLGTNVDEVTTSIWMKSLASTVDITIYNCGIVLTATVTPTWQRFTLSNLAGTVFDVRIAKRDIWGTSGAADILIWHPQVEDVTGITNKNPSEYVSTGVLTAPYHGANVDGVKWFSSENGNTVDGAGVVTSAAGSALGSIRGLIHDPGTTNKCTNYNANPDSGAIAATDAATFNASKPLGVTASDTGAGALFGVVDDSVALVSAGLGSICSSGLVLCLDNRSGSASAYFTIDGTVGNTNKHSHSIYARLGSGTPIVYINADKADKSTIIGTSYSRYTSENVTPSATDRPMRAWCEPGEVIYFTLNQLEESAYAGLPVITEGASTSTSMTLTKYDWPVGLVNDFVVSFEWTPLVTVNSQHYMVSTYVDANNYTEVGYDGTYLYVRRKVAGVVYAAAKSTTFIKGTTYKIKGRYSSTQGISIFLDNVKGTDNAHTGDAVVSGTMQIAGIADGSVSLVSLANLKIYSGDLTDAEVIAL